MDKLKKARTPLRAQLTKLNAQAQNLLQQEDPDKRALQIILDRLEPLRTGIEEADKKILDQMLDDDADEVAIETESEACEAYNEIYFALKHDMKKAVEPTRTSTESVYSEAASQVSNGNGKKKNFKLPKIQLMKFNGQLKQWLAWWSQFLKIHEDEAIDDSDKFQYLMNSMEDGCEAKEIVSSYPQSADNYQKAVDALKDRYGREDLQLQFYVRELLTLVISNVTNSAKLPLTSLYLKLESHLRCLATLKLDKADPATWLFPLVESSLSEETLRAWQRSSLSTTDGSILNPPKTRLDLLMDFIKGEVRTEQQISMAQTTFQTVDIHSNLTSKGKSKAVNMKKQEDFPTAAGLISGQLSCVFCEGKHDSDRCVKAQSMEYSEKVEKAKTKKLCFYCLGPRNFKHKCKYVKCMLCQGKHFSIMCPRSEGGSKQQYTGSTQDNQEIRFSNNLAAQPSVDINTSSSSTSLCSSDVLLNTLQVKILGQHGATTVRMVGDTGSQRSYIRQELVHKLKMQRVGQEYIQNVLFGGRTTEPVCSGKFNVPISSLNGGKSIDLELLERPQICGYLPKVPQGPWLQELRHHGIQLSDVGSGCAEIDILVGSDFWGTLLTGRMLKLESGMVAIETLFGWTLGGRVPVAATNLAVSLTSTMMNTYTDITHLWSLEAIGIKDPIEVKSKEEEEQQALKQFRENVARDEDGRYVVSLPWKESANLNLPSNRSVAEKRLQRATNQLLKQQQFTSYNEVFRGWENEGLIVTISEENGKEQDRGHYLPHRPVFKESTTTPVRPVFDASCKIGKFPSLNDCLYKGPNLLEIIPALLLRFREHAIGVSADIRKAFQMLRVREEDQVFQRFLWWTDSTCSKMKIYQHQRVVFGMNCSPFLLAATINQHLESISNNNMVSSLTDSFYVDNLVTSLPTVCDYEQLKVEATSAMNMAGMELRQWARTFVDEDKADTSTEKDECLSILGLHWNTKFDSLACAIPDVDHHDKYTKKNILSMVARIFDPIGFLSPALVPLKRIIQDSWVQELGWDDTLPEDSQNKARNWIKGMKILNLIKIPRQFQFSHSSDTEIHVFVDASSTAYAAVVYCRSVVNGKVKVQLLLAKSRLSPPKRNKMKTMEATTNPTIPRLELMACVVGTRLATTVRKALKWENVPYHFWTDSTTALAWIRRHDHWGAFVGNRVAEILKTTEYNQWRHVPGDLNPADLPSRGCSPEELLKSRWWEGPTWLKDDRSTWPHSEEPINEEAVSIEKRKTAVLVAATVKCAPRFSSYRKNVAVWGWILRFINQCRKRKYPSVVFTHHYLSIGEIRAAEKILIKTIQEVFPKNSSRIGGMQVCCDADGILKVQTRLTYRDDKSDFIQPILLPKDHPLVDLLIMDIHKLNGHAGVQIIMSKSREKYWIIQTRRTIKRIIRSCAVCRRYQSKPLNVVPSALPRGRVETSEPFQTTGVDLFGPMFLKNGTKTWVVIFTCAYFRCVHLETVTSLSTEAFLGSLERFISIYGRPNTVYSDNGTNFHGAVNIFNSLDWKKIEEESNVRQIQWIFNPPSAAWWGGFWERLIRSIKDLLKRILGTAKLNYDELRTCIAGVCATINNRPLTVVTEDNGDLIPLTPAIFLRRPVNATMPEATDSSSLQRGYLRMKGLQQQLQERFRKEYLSFLVQRCPSQPKRNEIQEGAVVLVGDERKKRFQWPLGIIVELYAGRDGAKRVAKVKTANGYLTRPLQRLYPLEINCQDAETLKTHPAKVKAGSEKSTAGAEIPNQRVIISKHGRIIKSPARYGQWPT